MYEEFKRTKREDCKCFNDCECMNKSIRPLAENKWCSPWGRCLLFVEKHKEDSNND